MQQYVPGILIGSQIYLKQKTGIPLPLSFWFLEYELIVKWHHLLAAFSARFLTTFLMHCLNIKQIDVEFIITFLIYYLNIKQIYVEFIIAF